VDNRLRGIMTVSFGPVNTTARIVVNVRGAEDIAWTTPSRSRLRYAWRPGLALARGRHCATLPRGVTPEREPAPACGIDCVVGVRIL
jgi:hypothetical protein